MTEADAETLDGAFPSKVSSEFRRIDRDQRLVSVEVDLTGADAEEAVHRFFAVVGRL